MDESTEGGDGKAILVPDFLQTNDWKFSRFAALVLTLQTIVLLLIFLDGYGLVPLYLRELVTFLFYSYVPGLVLLRVLRVHQIGKTLTTLLAVALSIAMMIFVGFGLDILYLRFSGPTPFVLPMALLGLTVLFITLLSLAYLSDRRYCSEDKLDITPLLSSPAFILYSLPLVAVLSTYILNGWNVAFLQIFLILLVGTTALAIIIKRLPSQLYPVAVVCIALAMLFHVSLMSRFPVEWADAAQEYWSANSTLIRGYWEPTAIGRTDSVLSVTILAPMYSMLCGLDLSLIFKVCYPTLFCIVPLGIYSVTSPRIGVRSAFLVAFLIISGTVFFTESLGLARQIIAEVMLVSILSIVFNTGTRFAHSATIACILSIGLVVSHYGVLAIVAPCAIIAGILYLVSHGKHLDRKTIGQIVGSAAVLILPSVSWYALVSSDRIVAGFKQTIRNVFDGLNGTFDPLDGLLGTIFIHQGASIPTWLYSVLHLFLIILSIYGVVIAWSSKRERERWGVGFLIISSIFVLLSLATLFNLRLFSSVSMDRFFHICLLFTAPLVIFGGLHLIHSTRKNRARTGVTSAPFVALGALLVVGLMINTGLVNYLSGDQLPIQLDMSIKDRPRFSDGEWIGAQFAINTAEHSDAIYADANRAYLLEMNGGRYDPIYGRTAPSLHRGTNIHYFISSENLEGMLWLENPDLSRQGKTYVPIEGPFNNLLLIMDKLYSSQESELYYKKY